MHGHELVHGGRRRRWAIPGLLGRGVHGRGAVLTVILLAVLLAGIVAGLYARLDSLGDRPLAEDEYYSVQSVEFVLEQGLPEFFGGGYYIRGLPLQYIMAGMVSLFGKDEAIFRLPSVLFSLLSIILAYLYARRFLGAVGAGAVALALLVSSWHIEFARFARMYTLLQCVTLVFLIAYVDAFFDGGWTKRRYLPHVVAVFATLSHALGVLFAPLLFVPLAYGGRERFPTWKHRARFAAAGLVALLLCAVLGRLGFLRTLGAADRFPVDYQWLGGADHDLIPPVFPFWHLEGDPWTSLAVVLIAAALTAGTLLLLKQLGRPIRTVDIYLGALLVFGAGHLFAVCALILAVLILRYDIFNFKAHPKRTYVLLAMFGLIGFGWLAYALASSEHFRIPEIASRWGTMAEAGALKSLWSAFFGWPDFYPQTIRPFLFELPAVGVLVGVAAAYTLVVNRHEPIAALLRHPVFIVAYIAVCYAVLSGESRVRYWFHLYPVLLSLIALAIWDVFTRIRKIRIPYTDIATASCFLSLFFLTSDFNPKHILYAGGDEVALRLGEFERFQKTWYPRIDIKTPAHFINKNVVPDDDTFVVVQGLPSLSYYLDDGYAVYYDRSSNMFLLATRERGTLDSWSGRRLLSTPEELAEYTRPAGDVWLVRETSPSWPWPRAEEVWGERLRARERAFLSRDGRVEVLRLDLAPAAAEGVLPTAAGGEAASAGGAARPADRADDGRLGRGLEVGVHRQAQDSR